MPPEGIKQDFRDYRETSLSILSEVNVLHASVTFHMEISHLIYKTNHMSGFYIKGNTGLGLS